MGVKIKVLARHEDGSVATFKADGDCYRNIGKSSGYIAPVRRALGDASPVTLTHENMVNILTGEVTEDMVEVFSHLWNIVPALRSCISQPKDILSSKRATFDVANYSLNEVMVAMFFMRTLVNSHAAKPVYYNTGYRDNLTYMIHLMQDKGWSWEKAYLFLLSPHHSRCYNVATYSSHIGGADAACFDFCYMKDTDLLTFIRGEWEGWNICGKTYKQVLDEDSGYTRNIRKQVVFKASKSTTTASEMFYTLVQDATQKASGEEKVDLFGGTISERKEGMDYVDAWGLAYDEYMEKLDA